MAIAFGGVQLRDTVVLARKRRHGPKPAVANRIRITASWRRYRRQRAAHSSFLSPDFDADGLILPIVAAIPTHRRVNNAG